LRATDAGGLCGCGIVLPADAPSGPQRACRGHLSFLIGFFTMINRRKALTQVLALLSLENGLFLAAISLTYGMPLIVELGILFDVLVAQWCWHSGLSYP